MSTCIICKCSLIQIVIRKSKLILFKRKDDIQNPNVYIHSEKVNIVNEIEYLGLIISNSNNGVCESDLVKDFNIKLNSFLGNFNQLTSVLKNKLFPLYCSSYYGSHLCDLQNLNDINVQWRKAIRRIWGLPWRAHCNLLYNISKLLPPEIIFLKRFVKFFFDNLESENNVINYIFRAATTNNSRLGFNYRHIFHKLNISFNVHITDYKTVSKDLCDKMIELWNSSLNDDDKRIGEHIVELIKRRDSRSTDF